MVRVVAGLAGVTVVMFGVPALLAWIGSRRRLRVGRQAGSLVLRMPRGYFATLAAVLVLPCAAFVALALSVSWKPGQEGSGRTLAEVMGALALVGGGWLGVLEARFRIRLDDITIERRGAFRTHLYRWREVAKITLNPVNAWFFLTLQNGERVWIVAGLDGIAEFAELALQRLPKPVLDANPDAVEGLRELAAA
ncbi:MAG TPA: PH domain-containing protein [Anaeromyxobacteraceae bacterium]|nr:PH domain-containing protein [Anaeromyxobacteraceae bacterium]